ncbi:hypothetical protein ANO11243_047340 [Dothideomycetidae sp. 11243]|nr:hypothetical protein ANO11243_047340 [fungal sp. No.11243]
MSRSASSSQFKVKLSTVRGYDVQKEEGCLGVVGHRKFYNLGDVFVKRTLRPPEYRVRPWSGFVVEAGWQKNDHIRNEAACIRFIRENTDIPVPKVVCTFEDDESVYLITEIVPGVCMADLPEEKRLVVEKELWKHQRTMWSLRSNKIGGPSGIVILPGRVHDFREEYKDRPEGFNDMLKAEFKDMQYRTSDKDDFVFCHNDYAQQNILVDPDTLKITGILDWEYAGFFPRWFDRPWYKRFGGANPMGYERCDKDRIFSFLRTWSVNYTGEPSENSSSLNEEPLRVYRYTAEENARILKEYKEELAQEAARAGQQAEAVAEQELAVGREDSGGAAQEHNANHEGVAGTESDEVVVGLVKDLLLSTN